MPTLRKRKDMSGKYMLDYVDVDGSRYRIDTGTRDSRIAKLWHQKAEELLSLARLGVIPKVGRLTREMVAGEEQPEQQRRLRLADWEKEYLDRSEHDLELSASTREIFRYASASFRAVIGNPFVDALTADDVRRWKRSMSRAKKSRNTISMYQRALRTSFSRAVKWNLLSVNPFADVEVPANRVGDKPRKDMDIEEVRCLLRAIQDRMFKRYVQFILYTGCRRNEILYLRREDLDLEQRILYVTVAKTNRGLTLPVNRALHRVIQEMRESGELPASGFVFRSQSNRRGQRKDVPWHPSSVTSRFKEYVRLAGLPEYCCLHACRHTYATHLRSKGVPKDVIQRLLGHTSTRTTDVYDHSDALFFREYADLVDYEEEDVETNT